MGNTLHKVSRRRYVPGTPGVPAYAGQPYIPAGYVVVSERVCTRSADEGAALAAGWTREYVVSGGLSSGSATGRWIWVSPSGATSVQTPYTYSCRTYSYTVFRPEQPFIPPRAAIPPTAAHITEDFQLGWTGRARSRKTVIGGVRTSFQVPRSVVGAVVGLNTGYSPTGYRDIRFAFYLSNGIARVMQRGEVVHTIGAYVEGTVFRIDRAAGKVRYYVNDALVYESSNSADAMHLDAALYSAGDTVDNPSLTALTEGAGAFLPVSGIASNYLLSAAQGSLSALTGSAGVANSGYGSLAPVAGVASNYAYSAAHGSFLPLEGLADAGDLVPSYALADGVVTMLTGSATGQTGTVGTGDGALVALLGQASDRPYGAASGALRPLGGFADGQEGAGNATMYEAVRLRAAAKAPMVVGVSVSSSLQAATVVLVTKQLDAVAMSALGLLAQVVCATTHEAVAWTVLTGGAIGAGPEEAPDVWVTNLNTSGSTRYEGFEFNSFAKIGHDYYGCRADGVYLLDGPTDAGEAIRAMVSFGKQDFGTSLRKRITHAYAGVSGEGRLFLKITADGQDYTYAARGSSDRLQQQRFDTGKGLCVSWLDLELYNADGEDFELASVEFVILPTSRRI